MPENNQNNEVHDIANEMSEQTKRTGKAVGKRALRTGQRFTRRFMMGAAKKVGAHLMTSFVKILALSGKVLIPFLLVFFLAIIGWYVTFEVRGSSADYTHKSTEKNELSVDETVVNKQFDKVSSIKGENEAIDRYFKQIAQRSFWLIDIDDPKKETLLSPIETDMRDYYNQETIYSANSNFLFALNEYAHLGKFIYPEQFINPIPYDSEDSENLKSVPITKKETGELIIESRKYSSSQRMFMDEKEVSVHDYGFASIFDYKIDTLTQYVEGFYTQKDVYDSDCDCVKQVSINEPFKHELPGFPKEITLIDKAMTFVQDVQFVYVLDKQSIGGLLDGESNNPASEYNKIHYDSYDVYKTVDETIVNEDGEEEVITKEVYDRTVQLYKYRQGEKYEEKPIPSYSDFIEEKREDDYIKDYFNYYNTWVPEDVKDEFYFREQAEALQMEIDFSIGGATESESFQRAYQYFPIAQKYGEMYGVDPYLIIAMMAQESGGNPELNKDGLMQITGGSRTAKATNKQTGQIESFVISGDEKKNPDKAIRWATMQMASHIDKYNGNMLKGLQAYNADYGGYLKTAYPEAWNDDINNSWMAYREEARMHYAQKEYGWANSRSANYSCMPELAKNSGGPIYGDVCYLENVLRYYAGSQLSGIDNTIPSGGNENGNAPQVAQNFENKGGIQGLINKLFGVTNEIKNISKKETGTPEEFKRNRYVYGMKESEIDKMIVFAQGFDQKLPMSMVEDFEPLFWQKGFTANAGGYYESFDLSDYDSFIQGQISKEGLIAPVKPEHIRITSHYGFRWGRLHEGIDLGTPIGTGLYAVMGGVVKKADGSCPATGWHPQTGVPNCYIGYGRHVYITLDNGAEVRYAHMRDVAVKVGQRVEQGQLIGTTGNSGRTTAPHLHFEYRIGGKAINPAFIFTK